MVVKTEALQKVVGGNKYYGNHHNRFMALFNMETQHKQLAQAAQLLTWSEYTICL